ncbi:MAG: septation protein IspZ [Alphaproteobacteria bacterium]|nr:septation protein IspZ [Alphaproteobacteria bacterium]
MSGRKSYFPFNAKQTVNILSEFGPLVAMFIVNAAAGINAGTWALIISTGIAMVVMQIVLGRLPLFPVIASSVTVLFGIMTLITGDPWWIKVKVTIFNVMFALFLFGGLYFNKNFFQHIFEGTFHYTKEGWDRFTWSFAWFFVLTAVLNEFVSQAFADKSMYPPVGSTLHDLIGFQIDGTNVWVLFKIAFIMPLSGFYAWFLTKLMAKHRIPDEEVAAAEALASKAVGKAGTEFAAVEANPAAKPAKAHSTAVRAGTS